MNLPVAYAIARDEWRYWRRSKLGVISSIVVLLLTAASLVSTATRIETERTTRDTFQTAVETFTNQPARHPHRMVHYGHYVFRVPPPLSVIEPGVDAYTGTVMFLEGHRQNSAVSRHAMWLRKQGPWQKYRRPSPIKFWFRCC